MDKTLTEQKIQRILGGFIASPKYSVDGLFVFRWESDKLMWTKAGYIYEFEIKISRADYKNDFKHKAEKHLLLSSKMPKESETLQLDLFDNLLKRQRKHYPNITKEQLHTYPENTKLPNYFYYAVPEGMLEPDEVPPYAGLIYITTYKGNFEDEPDKWHHDFRIIRTAPQLHKTKYTDAELNLGEKFYYNWASTKHTLRNAEERIDYYKTQLQHELDEKGRDCSWDELNAKYKKEVSEAKFYKQLYFEMVEGADYNTIERRMLIKIIKQHNPKFDYQEFMNEVDKKYKEHYPNRKEE